MSRFDYERSAELAREPFVALVMAAMRRADSDNRAKLERVFPEIFAELRERYKSPGGLTRTEREFGDFEGPKR